LARVGLEQREGFLNSENIHIEHALKKFAPDLLEPCLQERGQPLSTIRYPDDREPAVLRIEFPREQALRLQPVDKSCNFRFVSSNRQCQLSLRRFSRFGTAQEERGILRRHAEIAEAPVACRLQPYSGAQ
jgi:hypothetical protein